MPTLDAPRYYEHSKGLMHEKYDPFFRWYSPDDCVADTGNVEAPVGYVQLIEVLDEDISRWVNGEIDGEMHLDLNTDLTVGWYVAVQDDNGLIWAMTYGSGTLAEEGARSDFAEAEALYATWDNLEG